MLWQKSLRSICMPALAAGALLMLQGCNTMGGQPEFVRAGISPDQLRPGDEALITVELKDKAQVVSGIEGVVQEDQRITFDLNDRGEQSDQQAGDGVWTFGVKVPFQAPEGQFLLELTAFRSDGNPVSIRSKDGGVSALQQTVPLVITNNGGAEPTASAEAEAAPVDVPVEESAAPTETDSQAGESPSEASDEAEPSAAAEAPTVGNEPERNPKSIMNNGDGDEAAADDAPVAEEPKEKKKRKKDKEEAQEVQEAQPVEEAAPVTE